MRVIVDTDEKYPAYGVEEAKAGNTRAVEVPDDFLARWQAAHKVLAALEQELETCMKKAREAPVPGWNA